MNHIEKIAPKLVEPVQEALKMEPFFKYVRELDVIKEDITFDNMKDETLYRYSRDLAVVQAYLTFDLRDGRIEREYGHDHPRVLEIFNELKDLEVHSVQNLSDQAVGNGQQTHLQPVNMGGQ